MNKSFEKILATTWASSIEKLEDSLDTICKSGFYGVELPGSLRIYNSARRIRLKRLLKQRSLVPVCISAGYNLTPGQDLVVPELSITSSDRVQRNNTIQFIKDCIDLAIDLESLIVLVTSGSVQPGVTHAEAWSRVVECLGECAEHARAGGIKLSLEPSPGRFIATVSSMMEVLRDVNVDNLFSVVDFSHLLITGEDPVSAIKQAGESMIQVHISDNDGVNDLHLALGEGIMSEWELIKISRELKACSFTGYISLEVMNTYSDNIETALSKSKRYFERLVRVLQGEEREL